MELWHRTMQRGVNAFVMCRMDEARHCFHATIEIAYLRLACKKNEHFGSTNVVKPLAFLVDIYMCDEEVDYASRLLHSACEVLFSDRLTCAREDRSQLSAMQDKLTVHKKSQRSMQAKLSAMAAPSLASRQVH